MAKPKVLPVSSTLAPETRAEMIGCLQQMTADALVLLGILKTAHFNVKGPTFNPAHLLLGEIADETYEWWDTLAERAVQLGGIADGTCAGACAITTLQQLSGVPTTIPGWLEVVRDRLCGFDKHVVGEIDHALSLNDQVTANILLDIGQELEKRIWFVESHLVG